VRVTQLSFVFLGLSITSSWGNGHATTYRALLRELARRGHSVRFLERDLPYYAENRDLPNPPYARTELYDSVAELKDRFAQVVRDADVVIVGSYVPDGIEVSKWVLETARGVKMFYDIDTPVTLRKLEVGAAQYLAPNQIPKFDVYLSFTGGPTLARLARRFGARSARALYCSVDADRYFPEAHEHRWDLGYLGTYSDDRQPALEELMFEPARALPKARFVVAGPQYPEDTAFPENVEHIHHLSPAEHRAFYNSQRYTLNLTRADMVAAGFSPSVRLFEAAACGAPIISDVWPGIECFFQPEQEIVLARSARDVSEALARLPEERRLALGERARRRVLLEHTAIHRAETLEQYVLEVERSLRKGSSRRSQTAVDLPSSEPR
jgi:spore maturation protein CgeB